MLIRTQMFSGLLRKVFCTPLAWIAGLLYNDCYESSLKGLNFDDQRKSCC